MSVISMEDERPSKKRKHEGTRAAPLLPWMKVPMEIKTGSGVPFSSVRGLHCDIQEALEKGELQFPKS